MEKLLQILASIGKAPQSFLYHLGVYNLMFGDERVLTFWTGVLAVLFCVLGPYLMGSINTAVVISKRLYEKDIRTAGSKNAGMTNMFRVFGKKAGLMTLGGDLIKAILSVIMGTMVMGYTAGFFCLIGHVFPVFFRFKGGKGVLVAAATILCTNPLVFLCLLFIFIVILLMTRMVSLASIICASFYPLLLNFYYKICFSVPADIFALTFSLFTMVMIIFFHRSNIVRIWNMEENKIHFDRKK